MSASSVREVSAALASPSPPAPRLTRLELLGFKSFAARTVFAFEPGITAVVGPNGSGKSNVADAIRWVLGEQGHGALRAKRTEDVIFAGGQGRAPAGLAEAALTFDNTDRWLPTDFAEVTITRRAYRTGENHYLINGRRVRLKDVAHLTASLGQSHTVVGQGLVDAALSQRPEERRGLFEHAADLAGLRLKVGEAERSLAETEANSLRLADLLAELEPRLRSMERAARQAREWQGFHERLRDLQRTHFGCLLGFGQCALNAATEAAAAEEVALDEAGAAFRRAGEADSAAGAAVASAREELADHETRRREADEQARRIGHERDLAAERIAALGRRRGDMADTQTDLEARAEAVAADLRRLTGELSGLAAEAAKARDDAAARQAAGAATRQRRAGLERTVAALAKRAAESERRSGDLGRRRALLEQRRQTDAAERDRARVVGSERAARIARVDAELAAAEATASSDEVELAALDARLGELATAVDRAVADATAARSAAVAAERRLGQATTRLEALRRLHESGAGLHAGVRETTTAGRRGTLGGVRGTVAEVIEVPVAYDTAVEVALGGHLQDVVVERWADAEAAIAHLKSTNAGRATFQPIETVRRRGDGQGAGAIATGRPSRVLALAGVHGVAADLVRVAPDLGGIVEALLGRTLVTADLPTARAALPVLPTGWSAVTLGGEIARSGGSVTGGAAVRESGVLGRERELRELPIHVRRLEREHAEAVAAQEAATEGPRRLAEERRAAEAARAGRVAAVEERRGQRRRLAAWRAELASEQEAAEGRLAALAREGMAVEDGIAAVAVEATALATEIEETTAEHAATRAELERVAAAAADDERRTIDQGRHLAALEERLRAERRREGGLRDQERALAAELATRVERAAALDAERRTLTESHERLAGEAAIADRSRERLAAERSPLAAALDRAEGETTRLTHVLDAARAALLERERGHGASGLAVERATAELAALRRRVRDELDLEEGDPLPTEPVGEEAADGGAREREIARLKERLRRVGYVGEDAVAEFEREAAHQVFLRDQLADVRGAAETLRELLTDLHGTMRARFDETFARVATAFADTFATLFGGGAARLVLTGGAPGEEGAPPSPPGIDIVAQPPGKRLQSLALLSGGERALTAAALLFAILRVNPAPFCLLDEVDAALDEANVVRFRDQLRAMAAETQAIVVTHNRGTIETADTLYGVSMGADGVSQVLSLRMAEAVPAD